MPWTVIIFADIYNSILKPASIVKNWDGTVQDNSDSGNNNSNDINPD
jgi:hypothetical protein